MTKEELEKTAFLARLELHEEEKEKFLNDLNGIIDYVEVLQEADVSLLKPTTHVTELRNVWRDDIVRPCPEDVRKQMIDAAPESESGFYKVKKIIEAE